EPWRLTRAARTGCAAGGCSVRVARPADDAGRRADAIPAPVASRLPRCETRGVLVAAGWGMAGATIYDVAARAGVSIKSVSRVLNGEANVSEALRRKVEAAVAELGYRRSLSARSLAGSASSIIAALVDAALTIEHWRSGRGNDYLSRLELGLLMECRQADHHLMVELVDYDAPTLRQNLSNLLSAIRPQGVVLTPPNSDNGVVLDVLESMG